MCQLLYALINSGSNYVYAGGVYYVSSGSKYVTVIAPAGAIVPALPVGYTVVQVESTPYYYFNGVYYLATPDQPTIVASSSDASSAPPDPDPKTSYKVTKPPVGATVKDLPEEAEKITISGKSYFLYADTYYRPFYSGSDVVYMVIEKPEQAVDEGPPIGSTVSKLPEGANEITVKDTKYFVVGGAYYLPYRSDSDVVYVVVANPRSE